MDKSGNVLKFCLGGLSVGTGLFFFLPPIIGYFVGSDSVWMWPLLIFAWGSSGFLLGILWPRVNWRIGILMFAICPPTLVIMYLFSDNLPSHHVRRELIDLLGYLAFLPASCLGGWLGAVTRRHYREGRPLNSSPV